MNSIKMRMFFMASLAGIICCVGFFCGVEEPDWDSLKKPRIVDNKVNETGVRAWGQNLKLYVKLADIDSTLVYSFVWYRNNTVIPGAITDTFTVDTLTAAHMGNYCCAVSNTYGKDSSDVFALAPDSSWAGPYLRNGGTLLVMGKKQTGFSCTLTVSAIGDGVDPLFYVWYKNGTPVSGESDSSLLFQPLALGDSGVYQCRVSNSWGMKTSLPDTLKCSLNVAPPRLGNNKQLLLTPAMPRLGDPFTLHAVVVSGTPPFISTWFVKQGAAIDTVPSEHDTVFQKIKTSYADTGMYLMAIANGAGSDTSGWFSLVVKNSAPKWVKDTVVAHVKESAILDVVLNDSCSDADDDVLTFSLGDGAPGCDEVTNDGRYLCKPGFADSGSYLVSLIASDGDLRDTAYLKLSIINVNQKPSFLPNLPKRFYAVDEGDTLRINVQASDPDSDKVTYLLGNVSPLNPEITLVGDSVVWATVQGDSGNYAIDFYAFDGIDSAAAYTVVTVGYVNSPPVISLGSNPSGVTVKVQEMATLVCTLTVEDLNPGDTTRLLSPGGIPQDASFDTITGIFSYTPGFSVSDGIVSTSFKNMVFYAIDDGKPALMDSFFINLTVIDSNSAPKWKSYSAALNARENVELTYNVDSVYSKDDEGDTVDFSVSKGTLDPLSKFWSWTPGFTSAGSADTLITVTATDRHNPPAQSSFKIHLAITDSTPMVTLAGQGSTYNSIRISWTQSMDNDFSAYKVFYATAEGVTELSSPGKVITNKFITIDTITGLTENTAYYIRVFVYNTAGSHAGSNEIILKTAIAGAPVLNIVSPAVSGGDSNSVSAATPLISGTASSTSGLKSITATIDGGAAAVTGMENWSFSIASVAVKAWHTITVTVTDNANKTTGKSFGVFFKPVLTAPAKPSFTASTSKTITLSLPVIDNCDRYLIYRSSGGESGTYSYVNSTNLTSYKDSGSLQIGTEYWYKIKGFYALAGGRFATDTTILSAGGGYSTKSWFEKTFDLGNVSKTSGGLYAVQTDDKGYIVGGFFGANSVLVKITAAGDLQWFKEYTPAQASQRIKVMQTSDGGYITALSGSSPAPPVGSNYNTRVMKTDRTGDETAGKGWYKSFSQTNSKFGVDVIITSDRGYALFLGGNIYRQTASDTTRIWTYPSLVKNPVVITQNSDLKYIELGNTALDTVIITRLNSSGKQENYRKYGIKFHANSIVQSKAAANMNEYIASGDSSLVLFKELDTVWTRKHVGVNCNAVVPITDGFVCAGKYSSAGYFFRTTILGQKVSGSERTYKAGSSINCVQKTVDNGYILCGAYNGLVYVVKTDADGNTGQ